MMNLAERCRRIRLLICDVDGVLTDGSILLATDGSEMKRFHVRDGSALKLWTAAGGKVAWISGRKSTAVERRAEELGVTILFQGVSDKLPLVGQILADLAPPGGILLHRRRPARSAGGDAGRAGSGRGRRPCRNCDRPPRT